MHKHYKFIVFILIFSLPVWAEDVKYILHEECINALYKPAILFFNNDKIYPIRDSRGMILRFQLEEPMAEANNLSKKTIQKLLKIESFLAKIKNPVIIEVHIEDIVSDNIKNWEISAILAGNMEKALLQGNSRLKNRVHSVGYGEFLPAKNTPNNGGNFTNRVDIIILCNISGE